MKIPSRPTTVHIHLDAYEQLVKEAKEKQWSFNKTLNNILQDYITSETANNQGNL